MKHRTRQSSHLRLSGILLVVGCLGVAGCGSDAPKQAATAEPGSEFCTLAQTAQDAGDKVDVTSTESDALKAQIDDALKASKAAAAKAPKDFEDLADESIDFQERFIEILEDVDYDVVAATATEEGQELFGDARYAQVQEERDEYLQDNCDIEPTDDTSGPIALAAGDEGIRQLLSLLKLNPDAEITDEQVDCAIEALSGDISDDDIAAIANQGDISDEGAAAFTDAMASCGITLPTS